MTPVYFMHQLSDFDYELPRELIAAYPAEDRPSARLLRVERETGRTSHHTFRDIPEFFRAGDLLVLNDTKVFPARLFGKKQSGGKVEALLLKEKQNNQWEALLHPGGRVRREMILTFGENGTRLEAEVLDNGRPGTGGRLLGFCGEAVRERIHKIGRIPLPPYIDRPDTEIDREFYQTVFAAKEGAAASPTAGLHFDKALLEALRRKGVGIVCVTLHAGYGTFRRITTEDLSKHQMFEEEYEVTPEAAAEINKALRENRRVIACGTTAVRTLESAFNGQGRIQSGPGNTKLFIRPPYPFKTISGLITNFHVPKSSLLLLVAAFLGREKMFAAYAEAIRARYRFFSYGDGMLIL